MNIFVFGSNTEGRHSKGAALEAFQRHGACYGAPSGRQGDSYAIVTKELRRRRPPVTINEISEGVKTFLQYARENPGDTFFVTPIGTGLAGFTKEQIAPLFKDPPVNVRLPAEFKA